MNNGKILRLFVGLMLLFAHNPKSQAIQILEQKIISNQITDCDIHRAKLFFDNSNSVLISMERFLYANDNLIKMNVPDEYCCGFLGGFIKGGQFYIAFDDVNTVDIYKVQEQVELVSRIERIKFEISPNYEKVIAIPNQEDSYYLFGHYGTLPFNPFERARTLSSFGHGVYYYKPFLARVQDDKIVQCIKLPCGENIDESYIVEDAMAGEDSIHFLGFRNIDVPFIGNRAPTQLVRPGDYGLKIYHFGIGKYHTDEIHSQPVILYYANYNLKKEKNTRKHKIYENTLGYNKSTDTYSEYGVLSADNKDNDVFVVFSWIEQKGYTKDFDIENTQSDIYYWQCGDKSYGKVEKIAEGFCSLVRVDQFGIVHVFWLDRSGNIVQKVKKDGKWNDEEIILSGISSKSIIYTKRCVVKLDKDRPEAILYTKFFAAEFDKNNNLHAVYPTAEGIVYTKLKLE